MTSNYFVLFTLVIRFQDFRKSDDISGLVYAEI